MYPRNKSDPWLSKIIELDSSVFFYTYYTVKNVAYTLHCFLVKPAKITIVL